MALQILKKLKQPVSVAKLIHERLAGFPEMMPLMAQNLPVFPAGISCGMVLR